MSQGRLSGSMRASISCLPLEPPISTSMGGNCGSTAALQSPGVTTVEPPTAVDNGFVNRQPHNLTASTTPGLTSGQNNGSRPREPAMGYRLCHETS